MKHRRRAERADRQAVRPGIRCLQVVRDARPRRILADERDVALLALDVDQLLIRPGLDEDDPALRGDRGLRRGVDGGLDGAVIAAAVGGDDRRRIGEALAFARSRSPRRAR